MITTTTAWKYVLENVTYLRKFQHWIRWWIGVIRQQAITWNNIDPDLYMPYKGPWLAWPDLIAFIFLRMIFFCLFRVLFSFLSVHVLSNWVSIPDDICNGVVLHFIKPGVHENSKHFFSECISLGPLLMFTNISKVFCFDLCSDFLQWEYFHQPFFQNYLYRILQFYWSIYSLHMIWNEAWFYLHGAPLGQLILCHGQVPSFHPSFHLSTSWHHHSQVSKSHNISKSSVLVVFDDILHILNGKIVWEITLPDPSLTHWGRVTHICVSKLTIIGSYNGLSPLWS